MQVSQANNVKVYNLSSGKSLPEWISDRRKRQLLKEDVDLRRRIELIQSFDMPTASTSLKVTSDGHYLLCCGVYKPRLKAFDLRQLSMKFDRCFNSECVRFEILSDDFSKLVLLHADRYVEFHAQYGCYYRTRMPKFGRDLAYHKPSCDLYLVGDGPDVFRLNLERGQYMNPFTADATSINVCKVNSEHQLLVVGTNEGNVECFDPRSRAKVGVLDLDEACGNTQTPVTSLCFKNELEMAVGTSNGHVLIYDIRSTKPKVTKNHQYELPIISLSFHKSSNNIMSADSKIIKLWNPDTGKIFTTIEPGFGINDVCMYKDSGLIFLANEFPKNSVYFIPELGEAPKWCSFLDNITEELEEAGNTVVYDDYKFVTQQELDGLGLKHLHGTSYLKGYMHGYFIDVRLYHKAKSIAEPLAYKEYCKKKIHKKLEDEYASRVQLNKMPKVNKLLATKLIDEKSRTGDALSHKELTNPLSDDRFSAMFSNRDFEIDINSEQYKLLNPVVSKREKERRQNEDVITDITFESNDPSIYKEIKNTKRKTDPQEVKLYSYDTEHFNKNMKNKEKSESLGDMLLDQVDNKIVKDSKTALGRREMTFVLGEPNPDKKRDEERKVHKKERKKLSRPVGQLLAVGRKKPVYWKGKQVR